MKKDYINELKELLDRYDMDQTEKSDILSDYDEMYESWEDRGMNDDEIIEKLGNPKSIIRELTDGIPRKKTKESKKEHKLIAVMPFVSLVIFFTLGFLYNLWHISWVAFLLIPVTAIIVETKNKKEMMIAISPFISTVLFLYLGFFHQLWHPGWLVFLIIPVAGIIFGSKLKLLTLLTSLSPFITLGAFFYLGHLGYYHPGWLVFLLIPTIGVLHEKNPNKKYPLLLALIIAMFGYLYLYLEGYDWDYCFLSFIPLGLIVLYKAYQELKDLSWGYRITIVLSVVSYILLGYYFNLWGFAWLVFFSIPMYAIILEVDGDDKLISLMPFISVILFFSLGWFLHLWAVAWLVFLLIPVVAIMKEK